MIREIPEDEVRRDFLALMAEVEAGSRARQVPGAPPSGPAPTRLIGQDYFVEATVDNATPYLGEQVVYTFRIYRATGFGRARYAAPDFTGFWNKQDFEQRTSVTQVAGRTYRVTELRTVLFPTLAGPLAIEPATLTVPGGFLGRSAVLRSEPVSLEVIRLPENAPADFSGAVGQLSIRAGIDSTDGTVNEPLTHTVMISGQGNMDALADPNWPEMPRWRAFDGSAIIKPGQWRQAHGQPRIRTRAGARGGRKLHDFLGVILLLRPERGGVRHRGHGAYLRLGGPRGRCFTHCGAAGRRQRHGRTTVCRHPTPQTRPDRARPCVSCSDGPGRLLGRLGRPGGGPRRRFRLAAAEAASACQRLGSQGHVCPPGCA